MTDRIANEREAILGVAIDNACSWLAIKCQ